MGRMSVDLTSNSNKHSHKQLKSILIDKVCTNGGKTRPYGACEGSPGCGSVCLRSESGRSEEGLGRSVRDSTSCDSEAEMPCGKT